MRNNTWNVIIKAPAGNINNSFNMKIFYNIEQGFNINACWLQKFETYWSI